MSNRTEELQQPPLNGDIIPSEFPRALGIHGLFEVEVRRHGQRTSVATSEQSLTYDQLNSRANRLARHLQFLGVAPGGCVGVCLDRSVQMLIGLLGVLKAGAAYVPLDPAFPRDGFPRHPCGSRIVGIARALFRASYGPP